MYYFQAGRQTGLSPEKPVFSLNHKGYLQKLWYPQDTLIFVVDHAKKPQYHQCLAFGMNVLRLWLIERYKIPI